MFDSCDGHPDQQGSYHYHQRPDCVANIDGDDKLIGVMLDGYPIYSPTIKGEAKLYHMQYFLRDTYRVANQFWTKSYFTALNFFN